MCFPHLYTTSVERRKKYFFDAVKCALWRRVFLCVCVNRPAFVIYEEKMLRGYFVGSITGARWENLFSFWARREVPLHLAVSLPLSRICVWCLLLFLLLAVSRSLSFSFLLLWLMVERETAPCSSFWRKRRKIIFWEKRKELPKCEEVKIVSVKKLWNGSLLSVFFF